MRMTFPSITRLLFVAALVAPLWANATTEPSAEPASKGVAIGSSGFNDMMAKQIQPGTFATEAKGDGSFLLTNTLQTVSAKISPDGVVFDSIGNSAGKGGFGLRLTQWGRDAQLQPAASSKIYRDGDAVIHTHAGGIAEKFTNTSGGIQQDFIVPVKPEGNGELHVQLQVNGAHVSAKENGAVINLASGRKLTYDRLAVTDKNGKTIPAKIHVEKNTIDVSVNDAGAQYPLTIDPTVGDANWVSIIRGVQGANGLVKAIVCIGTDVYAGGEFTIVGEVTANRIAKWNGSTWSALGSGLNGLVYSLAIDGSGSIYVGGTFTLAGGMAANRIAKWNGSAWSALGAGMNNDVRALAVDSSGNLYAGGYFTTAGGLSVNRVAMWNGGVWNALGSGLSGNVNALTVDHSDNLYAGGFFNNAGGVAANKIAKWDGNVWSGLGTMSADVNALVVDSSGNIYAGGDFDRADGSIVNYVAKWNGSVWSALGAGVNMPVSSLVFDNSGNLYVGGRFISAGSVAVNYIAKWDGNAWAALGSGMNSTADVQAMAFDSNGTLFAGGRFDKAGEVKANCIGQWNGNAWSALDKVLDGKVSALAFDNTGNLYIGGDFSAVGGVAANRIAKWNGSVWSGLGTGMDSLVFTLVADNNGNVYAGGIFHTAGAINAPGIAKWSGNSWATLGTGLDNGMFQPAVFNLAIDTDGMLFVGGFFSSAGGVTANSLAKWDGNTWSGLGAGLDNGGAFILVDKITFDGNGDLYVGGSFSTAGGVLVNNIARWNGAVWSALGTGTNERVVALALDGNNLYAGGLFTAAGGAAANYIAKWNGSTWSALGAGMNDRVTNLAVNSAGVLYAAGAFTTAGGAATNYIAQWDGGSWKSLGSGTGYPVSALLLDGNNNLYVGGEFTGVSGMTAGYISEWLVTDLDGDGVDNSFDAFPNNAATTTDADNDGLPDFWLEPNSYGCSPAAITCNGLTLDTTPPPMVLNTNYKGSSIHELQTLQ